MLQTCEKQLLQGKHPICQTSEKPKSAANIRKAAFPGQTSDMSDIRKTKKCCIHAKISFTRANIRSVKHPKNQKVLQLSENQLYHGKHPICQTSEKPKVLQTSEKQLFQGKHPICQTSENLKNAANMQKSALPGQTSDISNIRKTKKCCKHAKTSFSRANIRCVKRQTSKNQKMLQTIEKQLYQGKHPICQTSKNQKVLQTSEKQLFQGKHPMCQTSEKPKSAANKRKPALPGQTSDMSNIRKTKKCCNYPKTSFTMANIRYAKHPKNQKCCKHPKSSFSRANIR